MKNPPFAQYVFTLKLAMIGNFQLAMFDCGRLYPENLVLINFTKNILLHKQR
jgi:hypothetical protein